MSASVLNQSPRLSDAMERELVQQALSNGETVSAIELGKNVLAAFKRGTVAFWDYMVEVAEALNEARAKDSRFSGSQW
ncbi:hypothetical protein GSY71_16940 [Pusillimonas sp. TS35]|uniref:hypothetical protein n=1 Tax=Paracandidimonas lactea TaxID=2895524 RepID=UPI00136A2890|nr:hypothetical protein [Paracandidimonas lactea]MYN14828.1 hypothetical protein [Pusillimonas sp. TS35]